MHTDVLFNLARRASDPDADPRHVILDLTRELEELKPASAQWPAPYREEFEDLMRELAELQPQFPSQRRTSVLFDRAGLGQIGLERARRFVQRLVALAKGLHRQQSANGPSNPS